MAQLGNGQMVAPDSASETAPTLLTFLVAPQPDVLRCNAPPEQTSFARSDPPAGRHRPTNTRHRGRGRSRLQRSLGLQCYLFLQCCRLMFSVLVLVCHVRQIHWILGRSHTWFGGDARVLLRRLERRWSGKVGGFRIQPANEVFVAPRRDRVALVASAEPWSFSSFLFTLLTATRGLVAKKSCGSVPPYIGKRFLETESQIVSEKSFPFSGSDRT